jgi:hypothetical protein
MPVVFSVLTLVHTVVASDLVDTYICTTYFYEDRQGSRVHVSTIVALASLVRLQSLRGLFFSVCFS